MQHATHGAIKAMVLHEEAIVLRASTPSETQDGTPFNVTSVMEEDIIEICIRLGHTHPMGVLCYSVTELVILF